MTDEQEDDDLKKFLIEIGKSDEPEPRKESTPSEKITKENMDDILFERVSDLLDMTTGVAETLRDKIESGSPFESDVLGFGQATTSLSKGLEFLSKRKEAEFKLKMAHELQMEREKVKHQNALELQEKRNEAKAIGSNNNITQNNYIAAGSRDEVMRLLALDKGEVLDV